VPVQGQARELRERVEAKTAWLSRRRLGRHLLENTW